MTEAVARPRPVALSPQDAEALAHKNGLRVLGRRPPLPTYLRDVWRRRSFLWTLSSGQSYAKNQQNQLGQLWKILDPLLLIGSYYLIFGVIIGTTNGTGNKIGFLSVGVIIFGVISASVTSGSTSIVNNTNLVRALHFPRAILPLSVVLTQFIAHIPAFLLLLGVMVLTGEHPTLHWLLLPVALGLQAMFLAGTAMIGARLVNLSRDLGNLIPVAIRVLRYLSGVFFPVAAAAERIGGIGGSAIEYQPFALAMTTVREALMSSPGYEFQPVAWIVFAAWAVGTLIVGTVFFWWDEAKYGRG